MSRLAMSAALVFGAVAAGSLRAGAQTLPPVRITAPADLKSMSMFIGADEIAKSDRPLRDAADIITKLRPDMVWGRSGGTEYCAPLAFVWVNGERIRLAPIDPSLVAEKRMNVHVARVTPRLYPKGRTAMPLTLLSILSTIKPEHIAEMRAHECGDLSLDRPNSDRSVFIVLKPGIAYSPGIGSYVAPAGAGQIAELEPLYAGDSVPPHRRRLIGVFDELTGDVIPGVEVKDIATGTSAITTATGTVSLVFLPSGASTIRLSKAGYAAAELRVSISPADSLPITAVLRKPE